MAHEISVVNGVEEAAYAIKPAWHGLGTVIDHPMTAIEALHNAHLDWQVVQNPLYVNNGKPINLNVPYLRASKLKFVETRVANCREDTGDVLGVVSNKYGVIQNTEAFDFLEALRSENGMEYEAAGALKNGRVIWLLARTPINFHIAEETFKEYILFTNSHDGSRAVTVQPTNVRVVCNNTLTYALEGFGKSNAYRICHFNNSKQNLEDLITTIRMQNEASETLKGMFTELSQIQITDMAFQQYAVEALGLKDKPMPAIQKSRVLRRVQDNYFIDPTNQTTITRRTALGAFNAVTQFVDHQRGANQERRFASAQFGYGASQKIKALNLAKELA